MPEPMVLLRRLLSDHELGVLTLAQREGAEGVMREVAGVRSIDDARELIAEVRERARVRLAEASAARGRMAVGAGAASSPVGDPPVAAPAPASTFAVEPFRPAGGAALAAWVGECAGIAAAHREARCSEAGYARLSELLIMGPAA
jgi:hypothetical protein